MLHDDVLLLDSSKLHECLTSLIHEQHDLSLDAATSSLSLSRLQRRVVVIERFVVAMTRHKPLEQRSPARKKQHAQANINKQRRFECV